MINDSRDFRDYVQAQPDYMPVQTEPYVSRDLTWASDCHDIKPPRWIVDGVVAENNLFVSYGAPKATKSFVVLDMAYHIATGRDWFGRCVKQGGVLVVCAERGAVMKRRVAALLRRYKDDKEPRLALVDGSFSLYSTPPDLQDVITAAREVENKAGSLSMIVIDTLAKANAGADDVSDMPKMLGPLAKLQAEFPEVAIVPIHHTNADEGSSKMRGRSDLRGAIDGALFVEKTKSGSVATLVDSNDASDPFEIFYRVENVNLGEDENGKAFGSGVVVPTERQTRTPTRKPLTGQKFISMEALREAITNHGFRVKSTDYPGQKKIVRVGDWKAEFLRRKVTESDKPDTALRAFSRSVNDLQNADEVGVFDDHAWIIHEAGQTGHSLDRDEMSCNTQAGRTGHPPNKGCQSVRSSMDEE